MTDITIGDIWYTQRYICRDKVDRLLAEYSEAGGFRVPVLLIEANDGAIEVVNGHHRLTAMWQSGRTHLTYGEYTLVCGSEEDSYLSLHRFGQVKQRS